ncbi:hypothetical protein F152LOC_02780 [Pectobacterium brasiliense]|nr:hypothetical protein F152LOC_02780 [Pectobacterium brasiliense]
MTVHAAHYVPAVGFKASGGIVGKPAFNVAVDRDAVVIIKRGQFAELHGAGQRADFVGNPFHHAAVTQKRVGVMVDNLMTRAVELRRQRALGNRHTDCVGNPLTQRAGGGFNAGGVAVFRVTRSFRVQLAKVFQFFNRQVVAGEMQQAVNQHGRVAVGQHEAVTVGPVRVGRIMVKIIAPQDFGDIGHAHRCARVTGFGFLHPIHAQRADSIGKFFTRGHA